MREQLSLEDFRLIKEEILKAVEKASNDFDASSDLDLDADLDLDDSSLFDFNWEELDLDADNLEDEDPSLVAYQNFYKNIYKPKIDKLLSYDLSAIPANEWGELPLISMGDDVLNFEGTRANLNFKYLDTEAVDKYNFKTCRVSMFHRCRLRLDPDCFDERVVNSNSAFFLGDGFSEEFREKYYGYNLTFADYFGLSSDLKEKLHKGSLLLRLERTEKNFINGIFQLTPIIGMVTNDSEQIKGIYDFVTSLGDRLNEVAEVYNSVFDSIHFMGGSIEFRRKVYGLTGQEFIDVLYENVEKQLLDYKDVLNPEDFPKHFVDRFPDIFLMDLQSKLDDEILEKIYEGRLTAVDYLDNYSVLLKRVKRQHFDLSIENSTFAYFLDSLSDDEVEDVIRENKEFLKYILRTDDWVLDRITSNGAGDFETNVIEFLKDSYDDSHFCILAEYLKKYNFTSVEDLMERLPSLSEPVKGLFEPILLKLGWENVLRFDNMSNGVFSQNGLFNLVVIGQYSIKRDFMKDRYGSYSSFEDGIYNCLTGLIRDNPTHPFNYRSFQSGFQKSHPEIFLSDGEEISLMTLGAQDFVKKFYEGSLELEDILANPKTIEILKTKDLSFLMRKRYQFGVRLIEDLGTPLFLSFLEKYGLSIKEIMDRSIMINDKENVTEVRDVLLREFYNIIKDGSVQDFSNFPADFKSSYPQLFLNCDNEELQRKFDNRELSYRDFEEHPEYLDYFKYVDLFAGMPREFSYLIDSLKMPCSKTQNLNKFKICKVYDTLPKHNKKTLIDFVEYCARNIDDLDDEKLKNAAIVLERLEYSNSGKLSRLKNELCDMILKTDNPIDALNKIERIYLTNNLPDAAKIFAVFRVLHSKKDGSLALNLKEASSPVLRKHSGSINEIIIYSDLLRAALESNNLSLRNYIRSLEEGERLIKNGYLDDYESLSDSDKAILRDYSKHLGALYNQTTVGQKDGYVLSGNVQADIYELMNKLGVSENINDRIVRMFMHFVGIDNLESLKKKMDESVRFRDELSRVYEKEPFVLEEGDLIKGIGFKDYLFPTMQNGALATEFLGSSASEYGDLTPLDTDLSYITSQKSNIANTIMGTISTSYGPIWVVIKKDNPGIYLSRDNGSLNDGNFRKEKSEAFRTLGKGHYGIRTGFGSTNIDYIITDDYTPHIGLAIAMQGFYLPVVNQKGELLFTSEMYDEYRRQMEGLSYYGCDSYKVSDTLLTNEIAEIARLLENNEEETAMKNQLIKNTISNAVKEVSFDGGVLNFDVKDHMDGNLEPGVLELIDIGSTGRGTNEVGDGDFDYIIRVDNDIMKSESKLNALKLAIMQALGQKDTGFRYKEVSINGMDAKVDIDISFVSKTDTLNYSTDASIKDRLETIRRSNPEKYSYVLANIIYAKRVFKSYNCYYKRGHSKCVHGGLGGVGVENWILSNHGSFIEAARNFLAVADRCESFDEFKKQYQVWDFGENFYFDKKSGGNSYSNKYDEFVYANMDSSGYAAMKRCMRETLDKIKQEGILPPDLETTNDYLF